MRKIIDGLFLIGGAILVVNWLITISALLLGYGEKPAPDCILLSFFVGGFLVFLGGVLQIIKNFRE